MTGNKPLVGLINCEEDKIDRLPVDEYLNKTTLDTASLSRSLYKLKAEKQAEDVQQDFTQNLKKKENLCDMLFRHFPAAIFLLNAEGQILYINPEAEKKFSLKADKKIYITQIIHPGDVTRFMENMTPRILTRQTIPPFECRFLDKENSPLWCRITQTRVAKQKDNYALLIVQEMEGDAENRDMLVKAKKMAEEASKAKSIFLANMSHELRTPIHTVLGMTELLMDSNLNNEQKKNINQIRTSSNLLLTFINHILDFSKIERGDIELSNTNFDLYRLLENTTDIMLQEVNKKGMELGLFVDPSIPQLVKGDPVRIKEVIKNLMENGVKYSEKGSLFLSVTKECDINNSIFVKFLIKDTGVGIEQDKIGTIFESFSQEDYFNKPHHNGTGIGLTIVKKLVELMNGSTGVKSEPGKGSEFWFTLPLEKDEVLYFDKEHKALPGMRVLALEDNPDMRMALSCYLELWGCEADLVENSSQWQKKLEEARHYGNPYACCLLDTTLSQEEQKNVNEIINQGKLISKEALILLRPAGGFPGFMGIRNFLFKPLKQREILRKLQSFYKEPENMENERIKTRKKKKYKILVVEDHEVNQKLFHTLLTRMGYSVITADDGISATKVEGLDNLDLIFMDIQMPGMNGYEVTRHYRKNGIKVPIIAVTANIIKDELKNFMDSGMNDYLPKPFTKQDLIPILEKWLHNQPLLEEKENQPAPAPVVFDFEKAVSTFLGQKAVVLRLLGPFINRVENQITKMKEALETEELLTLQHEAHNIKGGALNIQAVEMGNSAAELERLCKDGKLPEVAEKLEQFSRIYSRFKTAGLKVLEQEGLSSS